MFQYSKNLEDTDFDLVFGFTRENYIYRFNIIIFIIIYYNNYHYYCIIIYMPSKSHFCQWFEDQNTWVVVGDYPSAVFGSCFRIFMWDSQKKYLADEIADAFSKTLQVKGWFEKGKMSGHETGHLRYSFNTF